MEIPEFPPKSAALRLSDCSENRARSVAFSASSPVSSDEYPTCRIVRRRSSGIAMHALDTICPDATIRPFPTRISQATRAIGSASKYASTKASAAMSESLSGCPCKTYSAHDLTPPEAVSLMVSSRNCAVAVIFGEVLSYHLLRTFVSKIGEWNTEFAKYPLIFEEIVQLLYKVILRNVRSQQFNIPVPTCLRPEVFELPTEPVMRSRLFCWSQVK